MLLYDSYAITLQRPLWSYIFLTSSHTFPFSLYNIGLLVLSSFSFDEYPYGKGNNFPLHNSLIFKNRFTYLLYTVLIIETPISSSLSFKRTNFSSFNDYSIWHLFSLYSCHLISSSAIFDFFGGILIWILILDPYSFKSYWSLYFHRIHAQPLYNL